MNAFGAIDLLVIVLYMAAVMAVGLWVGKGQKTAHDYLLAGRDLPWWVVLGSIVATETSSVSFLSIPGLAYAGDLQFLQLALGYIVGRVIVARVLLPLYFRGSLYTAYEVLDKRFGGSTKMAASALFLITRTIADGLRLYLTALVLARMMNGSLEAWIVVLGVFTIVYTVFGGMKSVVWNDCLQLIVYLAGAIIAGLVILNRLPGGWEQVFHFAQAHDKLRLFDFRLDATDPYTFWSGLVGGAFLTTATHGVDQMMVQRYLCARSQKDAARALVSSGFVVFAQFVLFLLLGVALACFYQEHTPRTFDKNDDVFVHFIVHYLPTGARGLTLAAILAVAMSTLSSSLNSCATAVVNDFYLKFRRESVHPATVLSLSRWLTLVFGVLQIAVGIAGQTVSSVVQEVLKIAGFTTGILLGIFFLGIFTRRVGQLASLVALLIAFIVMTWVAFGTQLAFPWYTLVGVVTTVVAGNVAQLLLNVAGHKPAIPHS